MSHVGFSLFSSGCFSEKSTKLTDLVEYLQSVLFRVSRDGKLDRVSENIFSGESRGEIFNTDFRIVEVED